MQDLNDKETGDELSADEWNEVPSEMQEVIETAGITLTSADLEQFVKATAHYVANSSFYTDSGSGTAYVLTEIGTNVPLVAYADGIEVEFKPSNTNTGTATIDVSSLGPKTITGSSIVGLIVAGEYTRFRFDSTSDEFVLVANEKEQTNLLTGDVIASSDPDIISRGFLLADGSEASRTTYANLFAEIGTAYGAGDGSTTFNLPNPGRLKDLVTSNTGNWNVPVSYDSGSVTNAVVDNIIGDVWITDAATDRVLKSVTGTLPFSAKGDFEGLGGTSPTGITVDSLTGTVYVLDNGNKNIYSLDEPDDFVLFKTIGFGNLRGITINEFTKDIFVANATSPGIQKLPGATGSFYTIGDEGGELTGAQDVSVNTTTGDVWAVDSGDGVYKSDKGRGPFKLVGSIGGSAGVDGISVNSYNGDVWVSDSNLNNMYKLTAGRGEFETIGTYGGNDPRQVSVNPNTGDVWVADFDGGASEAYRLDGQIDNPSINWYIKI